MPVERILALGAEDDPTIFNMAHMGLRLGQRANGVSELHGEVSREMFADLWPGFDAAEVPITLGHQRRARARPGCRARSSSIAEREVGAGDARPTATAGTPLDKVGDRELWDVRRELRARLVDEVRRRRARVVRCSAGMSEAELGWTDDRLRPRRADHRLRPARAVLQAADADAARPGAAQGAAARPASARCRSSSPARATRPTTAASS